MSPISKAELQKIKNQTLIIWGENDNLFSIAHGEEAARIIPNAELQRIKDAGHLPMIDQPEVFNNSLLQFLQA